MSTGVSGAAALAFVLVLPIVVSLAPVVAPGSVAASSMVAVSSPDDEVTAVAGALGGLPPVGDPAEQIDGLEPATLPSGTGTVEVGARRDAVSELPLEVRETDGLSEGVEAVEVSLTPADSASDGSHATGSLLLSVAAEPQPSPEPTASPTAEPSTEPSTSTTDPRPPHGRSHGGSHSQPERRVHRVIG